MSAVVAAVGRVLGPDTVAWVAQATALSRPTAPDGDAVWVGDQCGLGHAFLRTSAVERAEPVSLDRSTWLTADVRLDDRERLAARLRGRGRDATIALSDAELVLHAYAAWDDGCLDHLQGDFAFALWDGRRRRLLCARDQLGVVPLHYARVPDGLLVATAVDALLLHPAVSDELDEEAIADFLLLGHYSDFEATAFERIRRVPPAHVLTWQDGDVRVRRYWRMPRWEPLVSFRRPEDTSSASASCWTRRWPIASPTTGWQSI